MILTYMMVKYKAKLIHKDVTLGTAELCLSLRFASSLPKSLSPHKLIQVTWELVGVASLHTLQFGFHTAPITQFAEYALMSLALQS